MPFIVRCPHCRKFMLIEDDRRGATGECLLCKQSVLFDSSQADRPAQTPTGPKPPETPTPADTETRTCPTCATKLRVPVAARGKKIRCPKCQQDFR